MATLVESHYQQDIETHKKSSWPSGPRRQSQDLLLSSARVRIPHLTLTFFEKLDFSPSLLSVILKFILPPKGLGENPSIVICETIFHFTKT